MDKTFYFIGSFLAALVVFSANIQLAKAAPPAPISSEICKSVAFDGNWPEFATNQSLFDKNTNRVYAYWIDMYGDLVIGYTDVTNQNTVRKVLIDNKKLPLAPTAVSMVITESGRVILAVKDPEQESAIAILSMAAPTDFNANWETNSLILEKGNIEMLKFLRTKNNISLYIHIGKELFLANSSDAGDTWSNAEAVKLPVTYNNEPVEYLIEGNGVNKTIIAINKPEGETWKTVGLYALNDKNASPLTSNLTLGRTLDLAFNTNNQTVVASKSLKSANSFMYSTIDNNGVNSYPLPLSGDNVELSIDKENSNVVYYTALADSLNELYSFTASKGGKKWKKAMITQGSSANLEFPSAIRHTPSELPVQVAWLYNPVQDTQVNPLSSIRINLEVNKITDISSKEQIAELMRSTADWQLSNPYNEKSRTDWHWGAFYTGLMATYEATGDEEYLEELKNIGQHYNWELLPDVLHADRLIIADIYAYLYEIYQDPEMIEHTRWAFDLHLSRSSKPLLDHTRQGKNTYKKEWWAWCDALYMAPPSFYRYANIVDENKYRDYAFQYWNITSDFLYSKDDSLYYRDNRFFDKKTKNGKKVFWSRGNGWVIGGIARILDYLPEDHFHRAYYEKLFKEITAKLLSLQMKEGLWTVSLLDAEYLYLGESSGSSFFGYALAWGINNGYLDKNIYGPAVQKAWTAITKNVNQAGRLGYVQQVAGSPYPFYEHQSHVYATGAFMLFAGEMIKFYESK